MGKIIVNGEVVESNSINPTPSTPSTSRINSITSSSSQSNNIDSSQYYSTYSSSGGSTANIQNRRNPTNQNSTSSFTLSQYFPNIHIGNHELPPTQYLLALLICYIVHHKLALVFLLVLIGSYLYRRSPPSYIPPSAPRPKQS